VSEIYGSGGYDSPSRDNDAAYERSTGSGAWENYNPEAELERLGITRAGEWARANADWDSQQSQDGDGQADNDGTDGDGRDSSHGPTAEAWDQDPDIDDDYYQDDTAIEGRLDEADLPTRADSHAATWEDHLDSGYAADLEPEGEDDDTHAAESARDRDGDGTLIPQATDQATRGEHPYPDSQRAPSSDPDAGPDETNQNAEADDSLRQRVADLEAANAELRNENTQLGKDVIEVESENAELGKTVTELRTENADLRRGFSAHEARLERLEQDRPDRPAASIGAMERDDQTIAESEDKQQPERREWRSNEAIAMAAATGGGIITTVADYWSYLPATYAGITASVFGIGVAAIALVRKHREAKDAHRPEH
jgi:hypothetical protein